MKSVNIVILTIAVILLVAAVIYSILRWMYFHKCEYFKCPNCGYEFKPSTLKMILSGNLGSVGNSKILKCPHCMKKDLMELIKK